jgi:hypothetical protein
LGHLAVVLNCGQRHSLHPLLPPLVVLMAVVLLVAAIAVLVAALLQRQAYRHLVCLAPEIEALVTAAASLALAPAAVAGEEVAAVTGGGAVAVCQRRTGYTSIMNLPILLQLAAPALVPLLGRPPPPPSLCLRRLAYQAQHGQNSRPLDQRYPSIPKKLLVARRQAGALP